MPRLKGSGDTLGSVDEPLRKNSGPRNQDPSLENHPRRLDHKGP